MSEKKITRQAYVNGEVTHREYYGEVVRRAGINLSTERQIVQLAKYSHDPYYNDIPLRE